MILCEHENKNHQYCGTLTVKGLNKPRFDLNCKQKDPSIRHHINETVHAASFDDFCILTKPTTILTC